ncbi:MAG: OmpA family protein [Bacteroidia bacterium]
MQYKQFIILSILFFSVFAKAQSNLQKADSAFKYKEYAVAAKLYEKSFKKDVSKEKKKDVAYLIGESYRYMNNHKEAKKWYDIALNEGLRSFDFFVNYGDILIKNGEYTLADAAYNKALEFKQDDKILKRKIESCIFAQKNNEVNEQYLIINEEVINSPFSEYGLAFYKDKLIFASTRIEENDKRFDTYTGQGFSDYYEAIYDSKKERFINAQKSKGGLNSKFNDGTIAFDDKNNIVYFMQCNGEDGKKETCFILTTSYNETTKTWDAGKVFEFDYDKKYSVGHPALANNGNTLYFVSDMPGGQGGKDIWYIQKDALGLWSKPKNAGKKINTEADEMFPFVYNDSLFYFSSNGHPGYGGLDIFVATIKDKGFSNVQNLKKPINSNTDDFGIILKSNTQGWFCSNRDGGKGDDDIWQFQLLDIQISATGTIVDSETGKAISKVQVFLKGSDGSFDSTFTNNKGVYTFKDLKTDVKYEVSAHKEGYFGDSKNFNTDGIKKNTVISKKTGYDLDFGLLKITKKEITIPNIYYDFDKYELKEESKKELDKLVNILQETPQVEIVINSHTDEQGTDEYNLKLSEKRSQSVVNYLIQKGIDAKRLQAKGYGESQPLIKNAKTEEEHAKNRRTTFQVTNY